MAKFTVDTHLFRELGDLLVGRDSTALMELVKNSYDADATFVSVYGEALEDPEKGFIQVSDDGIGMTAAEFEQGFLRIASRTKELGDRTSTRFKRRFTGSKGIGRLAAHKLAHCLEIYSAARDDSGQSECTAIEATIDWGQIEDLETLDDVQDTTAVVLAQKATVSNAWPGTVVTLRRLRREWTKRELGRFILEAQNFTPPPVLVNFPEGVVTSDLLFDKPKIHGTSDSDPGFRIDLEGDFTPGDDFWQNLAQASTWVVEINASRQSTSVSFAITPTKKTQTDYPDVMPAVFSVEHPDPVLGPFFQARILVREGPTGPKGVRRWTERASGIRVFLEGFRVLPYGEPNNDWLGLDADYRRRSRTLSSLQGIPLPESLAGRQHDEDEALSILGNNSYFGAVFLTQEMAPTLRMLINREGFIPEPAFYLLTDLVRKGIDLSTRVRAASTYERRRKRSEERAASRTEDQPAVGSDAQLSARLRQKEHTERARAQATKARQLATLGDASGATEKALLAIVEIESALDLYDQSISEKAMLGVLASLGTQMAAFIHEINSLLGMATAIETAVSRVGAEVSLQSAARRDLAMLHRSIGELRRSLERQSSYLLDIVTPDARRRRSRQGLAERFNSGARLVSHLARRRGIIIRNEIPTDLKSPPMFPAELTAIFSNLLTNAVKAAGPDGCILARAEQCPDLRDQTRHREHRGSGRRVR